MNQLTAREFEVATLVAYGCSNKEVANHLSISEQTVKNHVGWILRKIGVDNRVKLSLYLARNRGKVVTL